MVPGRSSHLRDPLAVDPEERSLVLGPNRTGPVGLGRALTMMRTFNFHPDGLPMTREPRYDINPIERSSGSNAAQGTPTEGYGEPGQFASPRTWLGHLTLLQAVLAGLILISIGRVHDHVGFLAMFRPALLLTAICAVAALLRPRSLDVSGALSTWPVRCVSGLAGWAVISSVLGLSLGASGSFLLTIMLPVLVVFFLVASATRDTNGLRWMSFAYVLSVAAAASASIFLAETYHYDGYSRQGGVGMYDPNDIGVVYLVGLPLAAVFIRSGAGGLKWFGAAVVALALLSLVLTGSRGGFLGLVTGGMALIVLSPGWSIGRKLITAVAPVVIVLVLAPEGYVSQMGTILSPQDDYNLTSETGRMAIWTRGMGYVAAHPVFGVGPDNFIRAGWTISDIGRTGLAGVGLRDQAPHNTFLQVWAELGTVGLALWVGIIAGGIVAPLRHRRRYPKSWLDQGTGNQRFLYLMASYLPASFIGFSATSFFVSHAYTPIFYVMTGILAGFLVASQKELRRTRERPRTVRAPLAHTSRTRLGPRALRVPTEPTRWPSTSGHHRSRGGRSD
jgi:O-antigen ligase